MKKSFVLSSLLGLFIFFTGCTSIVDFVFKNEKYNIPYIDPINANVGYEAISFGMNIKDAKKLQGYPIAGKNGEYYYGYYQNNDSGGYEVYYGHGKVDKTILKFNNGYFYKAIDFLDEKNPSLEYLHNRYGFFSDINVINRYSGVHDLSAIYTNEEINNGVITLQIQIANNGKTIVYVLDPFVAGSLERYTTDLRFEINGWNYIGCIDLEKKCYHIIFTTVDKNNNSLVIYYKKSFESSSLSSVKIGYSMYKGSVDGKYEIKTKEGILLKNYSSKSIKIDTLNYRRKITVDSLNSARDIFNTILSNDEISVRHYGEIASFSITGFEDFIKRFGYSIEELSFAIANEEF